MTVDFRDNIGESPVFEIPTAYSMQNGVATPRAYAGKTGKLNYHFYTIEEVNSKKSGEMGYEVRDVVEIVEFKNDSKCSPAHRIDASLFTMHPEILADYQAWKQNKVSNVTGIRDWDAVSTSEMGALIACGFVSVEQIVEATDQELMILGLAWKDIKIKANQHVARKDKERNGNLVKDEVSFMQAELAKRDAELAEMRAMIMAMQPKQAKVTLEDVVVASPIEVKLPDILEVKPTAKRKVGLQK